MKPDEVDDILASTLEDQRLTRGEKHALTQLLDSDEVRQEELAFFRHRAFALARKELTDHRSRQVLEWLEAVNKLLLPPVPKASLRAEVYFSPGPDCLDAISAQLRSARTQVDICVFTITDNRLAEQILAAHRRKVRVRIVTDDDKAHDRGSDAFKLSEAGIDVRVDYSEHHMHHKFAVFDRAVVVTGSYNWTRSAAQKNRENILVADDERLVKPYLRIFDEMWDSLRKV